MDREQVIQQLRAWVDGVDPATGTALPRDHPAQHAETLRLLHAALNHLTASASVDGGRPVAGRQANARNAGLPWSADDDVALASAFDSGSAIDALAVRLGRTRGAITARLVKLGKIEPPPGLRMRGASDPAPATGGQATPTR